MRKLASIRQIKDIQPIPDADKICVYTVDDWNIVDTVGRYDIGELVVYFEIDSHLPVRPEFEFLRARSFKRMGDREGFRLRTIKLRGQVSQGLILPLSILGDRHEIFSIGVGCIGADVTEQLGVEKYEAPIPAELSGQVNGNFPPFIKKTDQERCQNLGIDIFVTNKDAKYEVTMKLDGTSFTGFHNLGITGVCSRNWELKINEENKSNTFVKIFIESNMQSALQSYGRNLAVQGEIMGPAIQANREKLLVHKLYVFDIYDIDTGKQLGPDERRIALQGLYDCGMNKDTVQHVPIFAYNVSLGELGITSVSELLTDADGPSINHPVREGKVYKSMDGQFSFKAISNQFLLKEKD